MHSKSLTVFAVAIVAAVGFLAPAAAADSGESGHHGPPDSTIITDWNVIATRTIATENATPIPVSGLYFGFVSIAMYDAVVAIEGGYEPYGQKLRAKSTASPEVAAATAAYRVLSTFFPASAAMLDADYATTLAIFRDGAGKTHGKRVGEAAANQIIQLRQGDGRGAAVTLNATPAPGVWRPTPEALAPMAVPWLGFVKPLLLDSPTQFAPAGPDSLESSGYAEDFAEVKAYGVKDGSSRTPAQTETALFWNANVVQQYRDGLRDQVTRRGLDLVDSARAFVLLDTAVADSLVSCWRAKYDDAFWRPITAIRLADTDGNDASVADAGWTPLVATPPYPEYTSGHACITGAATNTFGYLFGEDSIELDLSSSVTLTNRHYDSAADLNAETMDARIWLGIHFRRAMVDGNALGHQVSDWVLEHYFERGR